MEPTRFEQFKIDARNDFDSYLQDMRGVGTFNYSTQVDQLIKLQHKMSWRLLVYLFGEQLGSHLAQKFVENNRNLLSLLSSLDGEFKMFLLNELHKNESLFAHT